jgi:hypothetical protein
VNEELEEIRHLKRRLERLEQRVGEDITYEDVDVTEDTTISCLQFELGFVKSELSQSEREVTDLKHQLRNQKDRNKELIQEVDAAKRNEGLERRRAEMAESRHKELIDDRLAARRERDEMKLELQKMKEGKPA